MKRILGIIPARAGSKGILNKNLCLIEGKSLVARAIESAEISPLINRLIVSTDSPAIAQEAKKLGCEVPFMRPNALADGHASSHSVVLHALEVLEEEERKRFDFVVLLQPTTPFRRPEWIDACIERALLGDVDSVATITNVGGNHPHRMYRLDNLSGTIIPFAEHVKDPMAPRQSLPSVYIRSGDVYVSSRECIISQKSLLGKRTAGIEIDSAITINIDTQLDLEMARMMARGC